MNAAANQSPASVLHRGGGSLPEGRTCTACKTYKEEAAFSVKDGRLRSQCRICRAQQEAGRGTAKKAAIYAQEAETPGETAQCNQCNEVKSVKAFHKSTGKTERFPFCKACRQKMYLGHVQMNEQGLLRCTGCVGYYPESDFRKGSRQCKGCLSKSKAEYKAMIKATNPEQLKASARKYYANHSTDCNQRVIEWQKRQRRDNPAFRLKSALLARLRSAVAGAFNTGRQVSFSATQRTIEFVGCSGPDLVAHLESLFKPGMSWENYGLRGWHIDHIRPCASFDLTDLEQQKQCFHYTNLQPLWWHENLSKGAKFSEPA